VEQETAGQVVVPFVDTVKPQLLPLPFGVATITYWLGQVALTFHVEWTTDGATMSTVTVQVLEPVTATLRLYQPLPDDPADSVAVQPLDPPVPPPPLDEPWLTVKLELPLPPPNDSVAKIW
jgi:hypothetical protein